jgi:hypothetical protein
VFELTCWSKGQELIAKDHQSESDMGERDQCWCSNGLIKIIVKKLTSSGIGGESLTLMNVAIWEQQPRSSFPGGPGPIPLNITS